MFNNLHRTGKAFLLLNTVPDNNHFFQCLGIFLDLNDHFASLCFYLAFQVTDIRNFKHRTFRHLQFEVTIQVRTYSIQRSFNQHIGTDDRLAGRSVNHCTFHFNCFLLRLHRSNKCFRFFFRCNLVNDYLTIVYNKISMLIFQGVSQNLFHRPVFHLHRYTFRQVDVIIPDKEGVGKFFFDLVEKFL